MRRRCPRCGAVVLVLARPGCAPNAATVEAVTAAGARPADRWRRTAGAECRTDSRGCGATRRSAGQNAGAEPLAVAV